MKHPLEHLSKFKVILGSASPRRKELFESFDIPFKIITSKKEELFPDTLQAAEVPQFLSSLKFDDIIETNNLQGEFILVTADTIVLFENRILGKPKDINAAKRMLTLLSGQSHQVVTGVTIGNNESRIQFSDTTIVGINSLTTREIEWYTSNYQVLDKAGAYGIQDWLGTAHVNHLKGTYYNVMGLPTNKVYDTLVNWSR